MVEAGETTDLVKAWSTISDVLGQGHVAIENGERVWVWDRPPKLN